MATQDSWDVLIVGAGAAGLMCGIEAAKRGKSVLVLEHQERVGKKILISGGGRCNFTNLYCSPENFLSDNAHFCKSALARYTPRDFLGLIEKHGIAYYEKTLGQLFCKVSAKQITGMLLTECRNAGVELRCGILIKQVEKTDRFQVTTSAGVFSTANLVIASGGLSYQNLGASDFGYRIAKQFGIAVHEPGPALVPLLWSQADREKYATLSGASFAAIVGLKKKQFREAVLFTHRGLSGPAILQISSYWRPGDTIWVNVLPDTSAKEWLQQLKAEEETSLLKNILSARLPKRFAELWCDNNAPAKPLRQISDRELQQIGERLNRWEIIPAGTEGYDTAEVTRGGVATEAISSQSFECKSVPGLYFIGEVLDVTGHLGGFNFQWAWASGFAAGQAI